MRRVSGTAASGCITVYFVGGAPRQPCSWFVDQRRFAAGKCPFSVLGLPKSASKAQVKAQYKQLAKEHHPDAGGCESKFREVKDAYEKCNSTIDENVIFDKADRGHTAKSSTASSTAEAHDYQAYANDHKSTSTSEEDFAAWKERKERQQQRYSYEAEGSHPWEDAYKSDPDNPFSDKERRRKLCDLFESATTPEEVDTILSHCLASRIFDQIDIGEPLLRALNRFHCVGLPLGEGHVQRCMQAVDKWEQWHGKKAPQSYYHPLMVVYSDPSATHHYPALDICQGVSTLLECVEAKGFAPDDWMMSLASKVFRTSPLPDW